MERTIKFRGKRCDNGQWVYGYYVESHHSWKGHSPHKSWILDDAKTNGGFFALQGKRAVIDESVGQFTGLFDNNGKEIYEGDLVKHQFIDPIFDSLIVDKLHDIIISEVVFHDGAYCVHYNSKWYFNLYSLLRRDPVEIVGNTFDNPELLENK